MGTPQHAKQAKPKATTKPSPNRPLNASVDPQLQSDLLRLIPEEVIGHCLGFLGSVQDRNALQTVCVQSKQARPKATTKPAATKERKPRNKAALKTRSVNCLKAALKTRSVNCLKAALKTRSVNCLPTRKHRNTKTSASTCRNKTAPRTNHSTDDEPTNDNPAGKTDKDARGGFDIYVQEKKDRRGTLHRAICHANDGLARTTSTKYSFVKGSTTIAFDGRCHKLVKKASAGKKDINKNNKRSICSGVEPDTNERDGDGRDILRDNDDDDDNDDASETMNTILTSGNSTRTRNKKARRRVTSRVLNYNEEDTNDDDDHNNDDSTCSTQGNTDSDSSHCGGGGKDLDDEDIGEEPQLKGKTAFASSRRIAAKLNYSSPRDHHAREDGDWRTSCVMDY